MACSLFTGLKTPILNVVVHGPAKQDIVYVFAGSDKSPIFAKLEKNQKLTIADQAYIKKNYAEHYQLWTSAPAIRFLRHSIKYDDTNEMIADKIFVHCSSSDNFFVPENTEMWLEKKIKKSGGGRKAPAANKEPEPEPEAEPEAEADEADEEDEEPEGDEPEPEAEPEEDAAVMEKNDDLDKGDLVETEQSTSISFNIDISDAAAEEKYIPLGYYYDNIDYIPAPYATTTEPDAQFAETVADGSYAYNLVSNYRELFYKTSEIFTSNVIAIHIYSVANALTATNATTATNAITATNAVSAVSDIYIKKHWPHANLQIKLSEIKSRHNKLKKKLTQQYELEAYLESIRGKQQLADCYIKNMLLYVNMPLVKYNKRNVDKSAFFIDLAKVFLLMRGKLNENVPFMSCYDRNWKYPKAFLYRGATAITKHIVLQWTIDIDQYHSTGKIEYKNEENSIIFKIRSYQSDEASHYSTLQLFANGEMKLIISFKENMQVVFKHIAKLLNAVDDILQYIKGSDYKIDTLNIKNKSERRSLITFGVEKGRYGTAFTKNVAIQNMIIMIQPKQPVVYEPQKWTKVMQLFSLYFDTKHTFDETKNFILMKYKKINYYKDAAQIGAFIADLMAQKKTVNEILRAIKITFNISDTISKQIFTEWKQRQFRAPDEDEQLISTWGVMIIFQLGNGKIAIKGSKDFFQLTSIYNALERFMEVYNNFETYNKLAIFKQWTGAKTIISSSYDVNVSLSANFDNTNAEPGTTTNVDTNIEMDMATDELKDYLPVPQTLEKEEKEELIAEALDKREEEEKSQLVPIIGQQPQAGLPKAKIRITAEEATCTTKNEAADTCLDLCEDDRYFLRRLQRYDPMIFSYQAKLGKEDKFPTYGRVCQGSDQPIVVSYDPEKHEGVVRESFTYSYKYGSGEPNFLNPPSAAASYHYICPAAWCPYHNLPIALSEIKGKTEFKLSELERNKCWVTDCPRKGDDGKTHKLFIRKNQKSIYPGFNKKMKTPEGKCLPCCFKKDQRPNAYYKNCLGENVAVVGKNYQSYIFKYSENILLEKNRYSLLPASYNIIFQQPDLESGIMRKFSEQWLIKGTANNGKRDSFFACIADIISDATNNLITPLHVRKTLAAGITDKHFAALFGGNLGKTFDDLAAFKRYIMDADELVNPLYLLDVISNTKLLFSDNVNIIILQENNIVLPTGNGPVKKFYNKANLFYLIYNYKNVYLPIYYVENKNNAIAQHNKFLYDNPVISAIYDYLVKNSTDITVPSGVPAAHTLSELLDAIEAEHGTASRQEFAANISAQLVNGYNKVHAITFKNGPVVLPLKANGAIDLTYPYVYEYRKALPDYKTAAKFLREFAKKYKLKGYEPSGSTDLLTLANELVVPVKGAAAQFEIDASITSGEKDSDVRQTYMTRFDFETETYERIKFEVCKYINKHVRVKNQIKTIVRGTGAADAIDPVLRSMFKELLSFGTKDVADYQRPNIRTACAKGGADDVHCANSRLFVQKKNLVNGYDNREYYFFRLKNDLLHNSMIRYRIMNNAVDSIIDYERISEEKYAGKIVLLNGLTIFAQLDRLFNKERYVRVPYNKLYDNANFYGLELFYEHNQILKLKPLNDYWSKYLPYASIYNNYTVDFSLFHALTNIRKYIREMHTGMPKGNPKSDPKGLSDYDVLTYNHVMKEYSDYATTGMTIELLRYLFKVAGIKTVPKKSSMQDDIIKIFEQYHNRVFRNLNQIATYIKTEYYRPGLIDYAIISWQLQSTVIVLEHDVQERDSTVIPYDGNQYIILYRTMHANRGIFNNVVRKSSGDERIDFTFDKGDLTKEFFDKVHRSA